MEETKEKMRPDSGINWEFFVAGVQHHDLRTVIKEVKDGEILDLVPEPTNNYDHNAVKIMRKGVMLGYVPGKLSLHVSRDIQNYGHALECVVMQVAPDLKPWQQLFVRVWLP